MVPWISISVEILVVALVTGAAVLALWTHVRYPRIAPMRISVAFAHLVGACVVAKLGLPFVMARIDGLYVTIFGAILPTLGYFCLSIVWAIALAQRALGGGGGGGLPSEAR